MHFCSLFIPVYIKIPLTDESPGAPNGDIGLERNGDDPIPARPETIDVSSTTGARVASPRRRGGPRCRFVTRASAGYAAVPGRRSRYARGVDARDDGQRLQRLLALGLVDVVVVLVAHQATAHRHPGCSCEQSKKKRLNYECVILIKKGTIFVINSI